MPRFISRRNFAGAILSLVLVGEPTVGAHSGLFMLPGATVLLVMYYLLFLLYETLADKYRLTYGKLVLLNFAVYSVLITGLFHREIADYTLHPHNNLITSLIRIQCSFFPVFVYGIVNRWSSRRAQHVLSLPSVLLAWAVFLLLLSLSGKFGVPSLLFTFHEAPLPATIFALAAVMATIFALARSTSQPGRPMRTLVYVSLFLSALGSIPSLPSFLILIVIMPIFAVMFLRHPDVRAMRI